MTNPKPEELLPLTQASDKAEFEAWLKRENFSNVLPGTAHAPLMWLAWQAGRRSPAVGEPISAEDAMKLWFKVGNEVTSPTVQVVTFARAVQALSHQPAQETKNR